MKKFVMLMVASFMLLGCGNPAFEVTTSDDTTCPIITPVEDEVEEIIADKNEYRELLGQYPLVRGLTCTVHNAYSHDLDVSFGSAAYTYVLMGTFNQPEIASTSMSTILPSAIANVYSGLNYSLRCKGNIVITKSDVYLFSLNSDDGSRIWIGGSMLIDNEGHHAMTMKSAVKVLERGVHSFRLDYSQSGGGPQGLILHMNGAPVASQLFYR